MSLLRIGSRVRIPTGEIGTVRPWWETDNMIPDSTPHGLEVAILMQDGRWEFYPPAQLQEVSV